MIYDQDQKSFGRFKKSKNSKLPLFCSGRSKSLGIFDQIYPIMPMAGKAPHDASLTIWPGLTRVLGSYRGASSRSNRFIFRTVAFHPKVFS